MDRGKRKIITKKRTNQQTVSNIHTHSLYNTFSEEKSTVVKLQEKSKMRYCIPSRIPIIVVSSVFIENMSSYFNWVEITWTLEFFIGEESQSVFAYGSVVDYSS